MNLASIQDESDLSAKTLIQAQGHFQSNEIAGKADSDIRLINGALTKAKENAKLAKAEFDRLDQLVPKPVSLSKETEDAKNAADGALTKITDAQALASAAKDEIDTAKTDVEAAVALVVTKNNAVKTDVKLENPSQKS
uniref:Uncharacterized protein n=1 Tax=Ditylenchus dipsaci TaxID=166011 RepID=A0A915E7K3_9BILA